MFQSNLPQQARQDGGWGGPAGGRGCLAAQERRAVVLEVGKDGQNVKDHRLLTL